MQHHLLLTEAYRIFQPLPWWAPCTNCKVPKITRLSFSWQLPWFWVRSYLTWDHSGGACSAATALFQVEWQFLGLLGLLSSPFMCSRYGLWPPTERSCKKGRHSQQQFRCCPKQQNVFQWLTASISPLQLVSPMEHAYNNLHKSASVNTAPEKKKKKTNFNCFRVFLNVPLIRDISKLPINKAL